MNKHVSLFVLACLVILLLQETCYACSCADKPDPNKALEQAYVVFSGKVLEIEEDVWEDRKKGEIYDFRHVVRFQVEQSWKGGNQSEILVFTSSGGSPSCGFEFQVGESYLVYGHKFDRTGVPEIHTDTCSRTALYAEAQEDVDQLGPAHSPTEKVDLSSQMKERKIKFNLLNARWFYHAQIRPKLFIIVPVAFLLVLAGGAYLIRRSKRNKRL